MKLEITTEDEARAAILAVSDYLLSRREAEPSAPAFSIPVDRNPTEKLTRVLCDELLSAGVSWCSGCQFCGG